MADPFLGEIRVFTFDWAPKGWARCDGAALPIQQNAALYSLIGIQFGGNGSTTFNLPDLRGRVPAGTVIGPGNIGKALGAETVELSASQVPGHTHQMYGTTSNGTQRYPTNSPMLANAVLAQVSTPILLYKPPAGATIAPMSPNAVSVQGGGAGHNNVQPSVALNFCIAMTGSYPPRD